jgi:hypothetical protein
MMDINVNYTYTYIKYILSQITYFMLFLCLNFLHLYVNTV